MVVSEAPALRICAVPVGATPLLCVLTSTLKYADPTVKDEGRPVIVVVVGARATVTGTVGDVLAV
jgi:hypothetical protein